MAEIFEYSTVNIKSSGADITLEGLNNTTSITTFSQSSFSGFTFTPQIGSWVSRSGQWPALALGNVDDPGVSTSEQA